MMKKLSVTYTFFLPPKLVLLVQSYLCVYEALRTCSLWLVPNCWDENIFYSIAKQRKKANQMRANTFQQCFRTVILETF